MAADRVLCHVSLWRMHVDESYEMAETELYELDAHARNVSAWSRRMYEWDTMKELKEE